MNESRQFGIKALKVDHWVSKEERNKEEQKE